MKRLLGFFLCWCTQVLHGQNVGIGTDNPTRARFEVHGVAGNGATTAIFGGEGLGISLQRNWPTIGFNHYNNGQGRYLANGYAAAQYLDPSNGGVYFDLYGNGLANGTVVAGKRVLSLFGNGNVSVGGAASYGGFTVPRGTSNEGSVVFLGTQHNTHFHYSNAEHIYLRAGKNNGNIYINDIVGGKVLVGQHQGATKFGINSGNPTYTLEVVQSNNTGMILVNPDWGWKAWELRSDQYNADAGAPQTCLSLYYNGRANPIMGWFRPDNGGYNSNSDRRLKNNIQHLDQVLERVMQLKPARYQMKGQHTPSYTYGFIAQDVQGIFPDLVSVHQQSEVSGGIARQLGIDYGAFSVVAIKAIQEQQAVITSQATKISVLEERLQQLEEKLQRLR